MMDLAPIKMLMRSFYLSLYLWAVEVRSLVKKTGNTRRNSDAVIVSGFLQTETTLMPFYLYFYLYLWAVEVQSMAGNR